MDRVPENGPRNVDASMLSSDRTMHQTWEADSRCDMGLSSSFLIEVAEAARYALLGGRDVKILVQVAEAKVWWSFDGSYSLLDDVGIR